MAAGHRSPATRRKHAAAHGSEDIVSTDPHVARRRIAFLALALGAVVVAGLGLAWHRSGESKAEAARAAASRESTSKFIVPNDRTVKADLLDQLKQAPQLLILGGSRATRFEPSYLEKLTGLRGFNLALQNGRPEDAWAFLNHLRATHSGVRPRVVWFVQVEAFRAQGLSVGLVQDDRFSRFFPEELIAREREKLPRTPDEMPAGRDLALTTYGPDGAVLRNRYDVAVEQGRTLPQALAWSINTVAERYATSPPALDPRAMEYFEKTLDLLNRLVTRPAIVFMPIHPTLLAAVRDLGWDARHRQVLDYLKGLQDDYDFVTLDLSRLASVHGDPDAFYDGIHLKRSNARRVLGTVVARAPSCFE